MTRGSETIVAHGGTSFGGPGATAAAPITVPVLLMTAEGLLPFTRSTVEPDMSTIARAVEVPGAGHWLPEENPGFVTAELLAFLADGAAR